MSEDARIVVIGATGYTGRLVAREISSAGVPFVLSGRGEERLARLAGEVGGAPTQVVDVSEPSSLQRLVRGGDVVINCAGPFTDLGEPVVRACVQAGAHYLDITGEQLFMKRIIEGYDAAAREAGVVVANAMAFEYALGDCAAAIAAEGLREPLRAVDVTYAWRGGAGGASRGTRLSGLRIVAAGGYAYEEGRLRRERPARWRRQVRLPDGRVRQAISVPFGEVLTVPRHLRVRRVRTWGVVGRRTARLAALLSPALPSLVRLSSPLLRWAARRAPEGPTPEQRRASEFLILADAEGAGEAGGGARRVTLRGRDPYGLTATITVYAATRLQGWAAAGAAGVLTPAQLLEPRAFLDALAPHGLEWEESSPTG